MHSFEFKNNKSKTPREYFMLTFAHTADRDDRRGSIPAETGRPKIYSDLQQCKNGLACTNMSFVSAGRHSMALAVVINN